MGRLYGRVMTPEELLALSPEARQAVILAVLVRNGVEDLHAAGAFEDSQAPTFNRLVRQELYQAEVAASVKGDMEQDALDYLLTLAEAAHPDAGDDMELMCLSGAVAYAVEKFAEAEGVDEPTWDALTEAAQLAVLDEEERAGLTATPFGNMLLMSCIADWEPPELGPEFTARFGTPRR